MSRLAGRKILITGGASGIGRATAALFRQEGASVAVLDRSSGGQDDLFVPVDVAEPASVRTAVAVAESALGGLDGVVNAAGVFSDLGLAETPPDLFARTVAVNLTGTFLVVQAAAPSLLASEVPATIVNIGSGVGITPAGPGSIAYVASKGGVIAMTKALALELAPTVRVNVVCPGMVETPMTKGFLRNAAGEVQPQLANRYALRRPASPEEIAAAILFLTAADSSFVTGITLPVDGGRTFHRPVKPGAAGQNTSAPGGNAIHAAISVDSRTKTPNPAHTIRMSSRNLPSLAEAQDSMDLRIVIIVPWSETRRKLSPAI